MKGCGYYQWEVVSKNSRRGGLGNPNDNRTGGILFYSLFVIRLSNLLCILLWVDYQSLGGQIGG